jgi:extracellular matrix regulatory protein A
MSSKLVSIGFGNYVVASRIISVISPDSAPIKRLIQDSREGGMVIDASCGKKTKSVIITDSHHVILSALTTDSVLDRFNDEKCDDSDIEDKQTEN